MLEEIVAARDFGECRAAWLLGLTVREYRALEDGDSTMVTPDLWQRMVELYGSPT